MTSDVGSRTGLRLRLLGAFVGVAAVAIAAFAGLTLWAGRGDVADLVRTQERATMREGVAALASAYTAAGGWSPAGLRTARALAAARGATIEVRDAGGGLVLPAVGGFGMGRGAGMHGGMMSALGAPQTRAVVARGDVVGSATFRFPDDALPPAEQQLRDALTRTTLIGIAIAVAVALLVGFVVVEGITRPLRRLTAAVRRLGAGDRSARANLAAPGELGELAAAVDRMAASLEREDELRRALTADVAHELRTPVTILAAQCEAIIDGVAEPSPEHVASLYEEVLRLGRTIEDLESLAAAEAAGLRLERRPVDLGAVVRHTVELLSPHFEAAEIALAADADQTAVVAGDERRLEQVVRNLLVNALKFTPGGGRVDVDVDTRNGDVRLTVADTGAGIPADELAHVFERFWRGRDAGATAGSGIGLAVVDELVRAHGGTVTAESEAGHGARFRVVLPKDQ